MGTPKPTNYFSFSDRRNIMLNCYTAYSGKAIVPYQSVKGFYCFERPRPTKDSTWHVNVITSYDSDSDGETSVYEIDESFKSLKQAQDFIESTWIAWANPEKYGAIVMAREQMKYIDEHPPGGK